MVDRALWILKNIGPYVLLVFVGMNWLTHLATLSINKPVDVVTVAAEPQHICNLLTSKETLPDWFSWIDQSDQATVVRKNFIVPTYEQNIYVFRPGTDQAGKHFNVSIGRSECDSTELLKIKMRLEYLDPDSLAVKTRNFQPFVRMPFRELGDFDIEYTLQADGENTQVGFIVRSCAHPLHGNPTGCWGNLEISFLSMFEPFSRWPIETAIGNSLHKFKALVEHSG